jgi:cytoskeletal protein CcmA (bactofilin family)
MEQKPKQPTEELADLESLDKPATVVEGESNDSLDTGVISAENSNPLPVGPAPQVPFGKRLINKLLSFNIYLLLFIFVIVIAGIIVLFSYNYSKQKSGTGAVSTTALSQDTLDQLANSDASVGTSGQVLNVQSSAVFAGKILARSDLEVAGSLKLGGSLNLPNINVTDTANLGQVTVSKNLAVTGNVAVQGQQTIAQSLQVGGSGTFSGALSAPQISTNSFQLNGDLVLTRHITTGGGTPGRSSGTALGSGGTASISGSDTAGSVGINTGSNPVAGCFITITFAAKYNATPHVIITPIGSAAGAIDYYINRTSTNFSICSSSTPPDNAGFGFDYFVTG